MTYFHGGYPGLKPGDLIQPPDITGTEHRLSAIAAEHGGPAYSTRTDVVYVATARDVARAFAALYPDGALYRVEPVGKLEPDPDSGIPGLSWQCPAAEVVAVVDAAVLFRTRRAERWIRMLTPAQ